MSNMLSLFRSASTGIPYALAASVIGTGALKVPFPFPRKAFTWVVAPVATVNAGTTAMMSCAPSPFRSAIFVTVASFAVVGADALL